MRVLLLVCAVIGFTCGCVSTKVKTADGLEVEYTRSGNQSIGYFEMKPDGTVIFEQQKSEHETLYEALNKFVDKIPSVK